MKLRPPHRLLRHALIVLAATRLVAPLAAQSPLLEYRFNETGTQAFSTGGDATALTLRNTAGTATDLHTAAGGGVSGLAGDRAFDNSASTGMGGAGTGGKADQPDNNAIDGLLSLTLQGWFRTDAAAINGGARFFDKQTGSTSFLLLAPSSGKLSLEINNIAATTTAASFADSGSWVFFAVSYDGNLTANNTRFYKGSLTNAVSLVETLSLNAGAAADNVTTLLVGNRIGGSDRPFDGTFDNLRIFGSTNSAAGSLSLAQLENFRVQDVTNVPEPSGVALLVTGVGALLWARGRKN